MEVVPTNTDGITRVEPTRNNPVSQNIDWYHEGEARTVQVGGVQVTVRFIGRKGRRGRISIEAPSGAVFCGSGS
jgi:hypothetical protein